MARKKRGLQSILGLFVGILISHIMRQYFQIYPDMSKDCPQDFRNAKRIKPISPLEIVGMNQNETISNSEKTLLFVGVMTAEKYLTTRAKAVYETWGSEIPGRIAFFSSEYSYSEDLPLVALPNVDDSYPPQKKSFQMLQYMYDHFGDKFEWFLRADDDVYIRTDKLESLLRSVDSRKPWFIGQAGRGNAEEFGLLSLDHDENFCMGGPGVILSRETLKRIAPHVKHCLENLFTTHEDVELGRCVRKFAGIQCTWSYEMQTILYHNQSGGQAFTGDLKQREVHRAISMHPVKQPQHMYRLHSYVKGLSIQSLEQDKLRYHRDIALSMYQLGITKENLADSNLVEDFPLFPQMYGHSDYLGDPDILGIQPSLNRFRPKRVKDVLDWEFMESRTLYSHNEFNPSQKISSSLREGLDDIIREVMTTINMYSKQRGRVIDYRTLTYGYWRYDPLHGADTILDMLLTYRKYRGHKMTVPVRRHAYLQQTFTGIHIREISYSEKIQEKPQTVALTLPEKKLIHHFHYIINEGISQIGENLKKLPIFTSENESVDPPRNIRINFILPLSGRYSTFLRFMKVYEEICIKSLERTNLIVILYRDEKNPEDFSKTLSVISDYKSKYRSDISVLEISGAFSRAKALQQGTNLCSNEDLMFFIDVDIIFNTESLLRIRFNTIRNKQIYFPIVFSQYNPNVVYNYEFNLRNFPLTDQNDFHISETTGFWRQFGFGIVGIYKSDFIKLQGFDTNITGWGLEDVDFYEKVLKTKISFIRSPDPGLIHIFHKIECDDSLKDTQKSMCLGTKASMLGSTISLENFIQKHNDILTMAVNDKKSLA